MRKFNLLASAAALTLASVATAPAQAALNEPVPTANYITFGGLDWVWASPCSPDGCWVGSGIDLSYQSTQGWRIPTLEEFTNRPEPSDFGGKCGSAWFTGYSHCDFGDSIWDFGYGLGQDVNSYSDTWLVRGGAVPEQASWAMMIAGLGAVGFAMRRRVTKLSFA